MRRICWPSVVAHMASIEVKLLSLPLLGAICLPNNRLACKCPIALFSLLLWSAPSGLLERVYGLFWKLTDLVALGFQKEYTSLEDQEDKGCSSKITGLLSPYSNRGCNILESPWLSCKHSHLYSSWRNLWWPGADGWISLSFPKSDEQGELDILCKCILHNLRTNWGTNHPIYHLRKALKLQWKYGLNLDNFESDDLMILIYGIGNSTL